LDPQDNGNKTATTTDNPETVPNDNQPHDQIDDIVPTNDPKETPTSDNPAPTKKEPPVPKTKQRPAYRWPEPYWRSWQMQFRNPFRVKEEFIRKRLEEWKKRYNLDK